MNERRRMLTFRAWRRGFREMDLWMGSFADRYIADMTPTELDEFETLLAVPDWEVYAWITKTKPVPPNHSGPLLDRIIAFDYAAQPG